MKVLNQLLQLVRRRMKWAQAVAGPLQLGLHHRHILDLSVEEIVGQLESQAELTGEALHPPRGQRLRIREEQAGAGGQFKEGNGLEFRDARPLRVALLTRQSEVQVLPRNQTFRIQYLEEMDLEVDDRGHLDR
jgi:hypothetical protein